MTNIISQIANTIKNWWLFLIAGIILIIGSIWVFRTPEGSYLSLAWLFSVLVLADGISQAIFSISNRKEINGWGWRLTGGIFEIIIGFTLILHPEISIITLPFIVGFWLMFSGFHVISASLELKDYYIENWGWLLVLGVLIVILAFCMILLPLFGAFSIIYLTSFALLLFGISQIMLAFKLKEIKSKTFDVVKNFKKEVKNYAEDLRTEVLNNLKDASVDVKKEITKNFDAYKSKMD